MDSWDPLIWHLTSARLPWVGAKPYQKALALAGVVVERAIATFPDFGNLASVTLHVCYDQLLIFNSKLLSFEKGFNLGKVLK